MSIASADPTPLPSILVIGESVLDVVVTADGRHHPHPGGSPLNVAVGLGRLGDDVRLLTSIGHDDAGDILRAHLRGSGVQLHTGTAVVGSSSSATARLGADGAARYEFAVTWDLSDHACAGSAPIVHTGSIATALEPGASQVGRLLDEARPTSLVTFDPNIRPSLVGEHSTHLRRTEEFFALADVVKLSDEDAAWLYPGLPPQAVVDRVLAFGPALVALTLGGAGSIVASSTHHDERAASAPRVVDTVGAGDSFMAGLIHGLTDLMRDPVADLDTLRSGTALDASTIGRLADLASACSAVTVQRSGADLPWRDDLVDVLGAPA